MADPIFHRYNAQGARVVRDTVAMIHRDAYADAIISGDPFDSPEAFMRRFDDYTANPAFDMVMAYLGDEAVGQIWGWPLRHVEPGVTDNGKSTFALSEIMVRRAWTGRGIAHALHDELLGARPEQQADLYVLPDNTNAYRAYLSWGWRKVAETRPNLPDAPLFHVLVLELPLSAR